MATTSEARTFKIHCDCREDIEVTGWLVAEVIGVYHTLQIVRSVTGEHIVACCMDYKAPFQLGFTGSSVKEFDNLCDWLHDNLDEGSHINNLLQMARGEAAAQHLDTEKVARDLRQSVAKVLRILEN
jgi:hypothetical protein